MFSLLSHRYHHREPHWHMRRAGMGDVWRQTRRGDLKLNSTTSADFDKPYLHLPSVRVITGRWGGWTWNMWRGSGFRGFDHHSPNLPHHAHAHAHGHDDGNDDEDKKAWPGVAVARVTTRLCWSFSVGADTTSWRCIRSGEKEKEENPYLIDTTSRELQKN